MDLETAQNNAVAKLPILKQGDYETWRLRIEQYFEIQDYALWDIIENNNSFNPVAQTIINADGTFTSTIPGPVTTKEKVQKKNDVKVRISTANSIVSTDSTLDSTTNLSDATVYAFLANQSNGSQLVHEDLEQIHEDDLKEMDLKWQLALLRYDKSKVEYFNCHKMGHFAWECRGPKNLESRARNQDSSRRTVNVEYIYSKAMVAIDGAGYNAVHSTTGYFSPPTIDLSNSGLKEFQQPEFGGYGFKVNKGVCENSLNEIKKTVDAPIIKDWVSDCDKDDYEVMLLKSDNVQHKPEQANQPKKVSQNLRKNRTNWNEKKTQKLGVRILNDKVNTAKINSINTTKGNRVTSAVGEQGINAVKSSACWADLSLELKVDGQTIAITKASVRRHLQLADADGISSLPNTEIFDQLTLMGTTKIYGKALTKLVKKVKHLEAKLKSTTERRKARMVIFDDEEDLVSEDTSKQGRMTEIENEGFTLQQFTPTKVTQGEEQCQESFEAQLSVLIAAKILADASREKVKTYSRRRSTDSLRDSTAGGLFSTAEEVQDKEQISIDTKEMARAAAREEHERIDLEKYLELQKTLG
ncbi:putative ribonuclease H-like domain-containing protein [Tanacetum coccineum]